MPFYEYKCDSCGHQFEKLQRISEEPLKECEKCGEAVRRIIFPSAIVYKGSGFYSTEYGRSKFNHPSAPKKETSSSSDTKSKSDSSSAEKKSESSPKTESKSKSSEAAA
mgnify:CR=1 FL=1